MQVEQRLLPCPFCGSTNIYIEPDEVGSGGQWVGPLHIGCNVQTGCGASIAPDDERESLIAAWNTRFEASLPPSAPVDRDALRMILWKHLGGDSRYVAINAALDDIAALTPSVLAESTSNDCLLVAEAVPQPVETAPKDGSYFLFIGTNFDGGMAVVHWDDGLEWWQLDDGKNFEIALRHEHGLTGWIPLPTIRSLDLSGVGVG